MDGRRFLGSDFLGAGQTKAETQRKRAKEGHRQALAAQICRTKQVSYRGIDPEIEFTPALFQSSYTCRFGPSLALAQALRAFSRPSHNRATVFRYSLSAAACERSGSRAE